MSAFRSEGEKWIWAAAFVAAEARPGLSPGDAARWAGECVVEARIVLQTSQMRGSMANHFGAMLREMLGEGEGKAVEEAAPLLCPRCKRAATVFIHCPTCHGTGQPGCEPGPDDPGFVEFPGTGQPESEE
ncbi:MAG: hypothetical protein ACYTBJ_02210 [Planctomycetota bacterium]|jgi:hypothetical protein